MASIRDWVSRRVVGPIKVQLRQGLSPERFSASLALGLACALFPIFGATTTLCIVVGVPLKLNQPTMQIVNHIAGPAQVALVIPFIRLGEHLFRAPRLPLSATQILEALRADTLQALAFFWTSLWHAMVAWLLVAPPLALVLTGCLIPIMRRVLPRSIRT